MGVLEARPNSPSLDLEENENTPDELLDTGILHRMKQHSKLGHGIAEFLEGGGGGDMESDHADEDAVPLEDVNLDELEPNQLMVTNSYRRIGRRMFWTRIFFPFLPYVGFAATVYAMNDTYLRVVRFRHSQGITYPGPPVVLKTCVKIISWMTLLVTICNIWMPPITYIAVIVSSVTIFLAPYYVILNDRAQNSAKAITLLGMFSVVIHGVAWFYAWSIFGSVQVFFPSAMIAFWILHSIITCIFLCTDSFTWCCFCCIPTAVNLSICVLGLIACIIIYLLNIAFMFNMPQSLVIIFVVDIICLILDSIAYAKCSNALTVYIDDESFDESALRNLDNPDVEKNDDLYVSIPAIARNFWIARAVLERNWVAISLGTLATYFAFVIPFTFGLLGMPVFACVVNYMLTCIQNESGEYRGEIKSLFTLRFLGKRTWVNLMFSSWILVLIYVLCSLASALTLGFLWLVFWPLFIYYIPLVVFKSDTADHEDQLPVNCFSAFGRSRMAIMMTSYKEHFLYLFLQAQGVAFIILLSFIPIFGPGLALVSAFVFVPMTAIMNIASYKQVFDDTLGEPDTPFQDRLYAAEVLGAEEEKFLEKRERKERIKSHKLHAGTAKIIPTRGGSIGGYGEDNSSSDSRHGRNALVNTPPGQF